jgi:cation diffusion facilitator CzcD-associated flavoprotein CzcO
MSRRLRVAIIGAGVSGLCVADRLRRLRGVDVTVLERSDRVGGTWRENTYPGCACDIPAPLYSYSFAQSGAWSRLFASQAEVLGYLERFAERSGLLDDICFGTDVQGASWTDDGWDISCRGGEVVRADVLVSAIGALSVPARPDLPGLREFAGKAVHTAEWDDDLELDGRRVAVIGTGASAIQLVPAIADRAAGVTVFQRTPPWIVPKLDRAFTPRERRLLRTLRPYRRLVRNRLFWIHEARARGFHGDVEAMAKIERLARAHLQHQVPDAALRSDLTPDYAVGCKRLLISSDWYPTLQRDDVALETAPIARVARDAIVTARGTRHPADVVVFGTGFAAQDALSRVPITGPDGRTLKDAWRSGMEAYLGTMVAGFPNLFLMTGPNSGLGHNSQIFMIEAQTRYVAAHARRLRRAARTVEVRPAAQRAFNDDIQARLRGTVWQGGGCRSWYQDPATGRNTLLWPGSTIEFWRRTRVLARAAHTVRP